MSNLFFTFLTLLLIFESTRATPGPKLLGKKSLDSDSSTPNNSKNSKKSKNSKAENSVMATNRLQKELKKMMENQDKNKDLLIIDVDEKNLYKWNVKIKMAAFDKDSALIVTMRQHNVDYLLFEFIFDGEFPMEPPFVRLVSPHIVGGYIFGGGALCMELLTPEGWSPTYTIEGVIMQIAATMAKGHAEVVSKSAPEKYSMQGAREGFANVLRIHKNGNWASLPEHD